MVRPNGPIPGQSRHKVIVETDQPWHFVPRRLAERAWRPLAGLSWPHPKWAPYDLIHSFNAIPITSKPFLVTFESILPRTLGKGGAALGHRLRERLLSEQCRALVAMSWYARGKFQKANLGWGPLEELVEEKMHVVYPHFDAQPSASVRQYSPDTELRLVFVGNDFARKGGIVALRAMQRAAKAGIPVKLDIVSGMRVGGTVYTDHADPGQYENDLKLLSLRAVTVHGQLPNAKVLELMANAHLVLLPTMDDTFGYSVVEGYSVGTPAIGTTVCALPELVGADCGAVLNLAFDEWGNWAGLPPNNAYRDTGAYWGELDATYSKLADQLVFELQEIMAAPDTIERWSVGALERFDEDHDTRVVGERLDEFYDELLHETPASVDKPC
jgi:glycosyltransferase involved in cell wall biosynthesis